MALLVADASPIVGFVAAHQHDLLWQVTVQTHGHILVPAHVDGEIADIAASKSRKAASNYQWLKDQNHVRVLDRVDIFSPVANLASTLLDTSASDFHDRTKDLGEALTVAHARNFRRQGTPADVLIDDGKGVRWADTYKITCHGTVWIFTEAIMQKRLTTKDDLEAAYTAVARHSRLPELGKTGLPDLL